MKKRIKISFIVFIFSFIFLVFLLMPNVIVQSLSPGSLETLRSKAGVECLENSQCSFGEECVDNFCFEKEEIDSCKKVDLSTSVKKLESGMKLNSAKMVLTRRDLPFLLADGEIDELVDGEIVKYFYTPSIILGENIISNETGNSMITSSELPLFVYRITFSNPIDFSSEDIQGQAIRILGEEYKINSESKNSKVGFELSNNYIFVEESKENNIKISKDKEGKVLSIDMPFYLTEDMKKGDSVSDSYFNSIELSIREADENYIELEVGKKC